MSTIAPVVQDVTVGTAVAEPRSAATRIGRNTAFRVVAQSLSALINVAGMLILGRHLSASGYGEYVAWYALAPLLASVADLGMGVGVTRAIARDPGSAPRVLGDALLVRALVALVVLLGVAGLAWPVLGAARTVLVVCVAAAALLDFGADAAVWVSRGRERLEVEAVLLLVSQLVWLAGIATAAALSAALPAFLGVAAVAFALRTGAGAAWLARQGVRPVFEMAWPRIAAAVREGLPVAFALLLVVLYGRAGVFALQLGSTPAEVGCFNVAWMLAQPLGFLASSLAVALFPSVARAGADRAALAAPLRAANRYQWMLSLPIAAGLSLVAPAVVPLFFPDRAGFASAASALRVMALALPFVFLNLQSRYLLAACDAAAVYLRAVALGLVIEVVGCALLVREHGALGAAWTFVAAEIVVFAVTQSALARRSGSAGLFGEAVRPAIATAVMAAAVVALATQPLALVVAAGAAVYAVSLAVVGGWRGRESRLLADVIRSFQPVRRAPDVRPGRPS